MKLLYAIFALCMLVCLGAYAWAAQTFAPWWAGTAAAVVSAVILAIIQPLFKSEKIGWLLASGLLNMLAGIVLQFGFIPLLLEWPFIGFILWCGAWLYAAYWFLAEHTIAAFTPQARYSWRILIAITMPKKNKLPIGQLIKDFSSSSCCMFSLPRAGRFSCWLFQGKEGNGGIQRCI